MLDLQERGCENIIILPLYPQYAALRGDPSDNLPGIPGVGEKTAAKLINAYGGLDGIFEHAEEQTPKLRQNLIEFEERARRNVDAMVLRTDAPVDLDLASVKWGTINTDEVRQLFEELEFNSLYERLGELLGDELPTMGSQENVLEAEKSFKIMKKLQLNTSLQVIQ